MSRQARVVIPGIPHHITQRGVRRTTTFFDFEDLELYSRLLRKYSCQHGLRIHAYCWMPNHTHVVATPEHSGSLALTFRQVHSIYAQEFNSKYGFHGYLWQERPFSCPMDERHFICAIRYVERNPVRAGLAARCEDYRWSSASAHCRKEADPLLDDVGELSDIHDWSAWLALPNEPEIDDRIRHGTISGHPCGSEDFVKRMERLTGRSFAPEKRGRKKATPDERQLKLLS